MHIDDATPAGPDSEYLWLRDGSLPRTREDRIAEAVAVFALVFALGVGIVIAMLPVPAKATVAAEASFSPSAAHLVGAHDVH